MSERAEGVVVVGPVSWNTIVQVPRPPGPRPQTLSAKDSWAALSDQRIRLVTERVEGRSERHLNLMADGDRLSIYLSLPPATSATAAIWTDLHDYDGGSPFHQPFLDAADVVFMSNDAVGDPRALMTRLAAAGKRLVVCTLGPEGALDGDGWHRVPAAPATVIDTNGAGDAFLAGFLSAALGGRTVPQAPRGGAAQAVKALGSRHLCPPLPGGD